MYKYISFHSSFSTLLSVRVSYFYVLLSLDIAVHWAQVRTHMYNLVFAMCQSDVNELFGWVIIRRILVQSPNSWIHKLQTEIQSLWSLNTSCLSLLGQKSFIFVGISLFVTDCSNLFFPIESLYCSGLGVLPNIGCSQSYFSKRGPQ